MRIDVLNFLTIFNSNVLKFLLILRVIFCEYLRNYTQYIVSKTSGHVTFENTPMTAELR